MKQFPSAIFILLTLIAPLITSLSCDSESPQICFQTFGGASRCIFSHPPNSSLPTTGFCSAADGSGDPADESGDTAVGSTGTETTGTGSTGTESTGIKSATISSFFGFGNSGLNQTVRT